MPEDPKAPTISATKQEILNFIVDNMRIADTSLIKALLAAIPTLQGSEKANKINDFIYKIESYFSNVNYDDVKKVQFASTKLSDMAILWFRDNKEIKDWESFKKQLLNKFISAENHQIVLAQLNNIEFNGNLRAHVEKYRSILSETKPRGDEENVYSILRTLPEQIRQEIWSNGDNLKSFENVCAALL
jgi:Ty3 transposon capsid-like protein